MTGQQFFHQLYIAECREIIRKAREKHMREWRSRNCNCGLCKEKT